MVEKKQFFVTGYRDDVFVVEAVNQREAVKKVAARQQNTNELEMHLDVLNLEQVLSKSFDGVEFLK